MALSNRFNEGTKIADEKEWLRIDATHGGSLEARAHEIRSGPIHITKMESRIGAVAQVLGFDIGATAALFNVDEQTIKNHRGDIRRKMGKPKSVCDFDMIFENYPPPQINEQKKNDE